MVMLADLRFVASRLAAPRLAAIVLLCLAQAALAQGAETLGAQAQGTETEQPQTPVILISIDGYRADYSDRGISPNIAAIAAEGASAPMRPSFPTKTFPNHYTLVTGLRPDRNGIVGNTMIDPRRPNAMFSLGDPHQSLDPFWWDEAEPIWVTAEKQGVRTATMFWPGSEVAIHEMRPQDWQRFDQNVTGRQRVNAVLDWMRRPADIRPRFVTLYFDTVDTAGHRFGPDSEEVNAAIRDVDGEIGYLRDGLRVIGVKADLVLVADHGMRATDDARVIQLADILDLKSFILVEGGPYAAIEPAAGTDDIVYDALLKRHDHMDCARKEKLSERLHYGRNPRVAAIICIADPGWTILAGDPPYPVKGGAHGYDNEDPQMLALFAASGPDINGKAPGTFDNVDIYPLLARLIGITPLANDGRDALAKAIVRK